MALVVSLDQVEDQVQALLWGQGSVVASICLIGLLEAIVDLKSTFHGPSIAYCKYAGATYVSTLSHPHRDRIRSAIRSRAACASRSSQLRKP